MATTKELLDIHATEIANGADVRLNGKPVTKPPVKKITKPPVKKADKQSTKPVVEKKEVAKVDSLKVRGLELKANSKGRVWNFVRELADGPGFTKQDLNTIMEFARPKRTKEWKTGRVEWAWKFYASKNKLNGKKESAKKAS